MTRVIALIMLLSAVVPAVAGSKLDSLPTVDPEAQQPGMEIPRVARPKQNTPKSFRGSASRPQILPLPPGANIALDPTAPPPVARTPQPPPVRPAPSVAARPMPPIGHPYVRVQPSPEQIVGLFVGAVIQIIQATRR